jgi:hypothetical protein
MRAQFISEMYLGQAISTIWSMSEQRRRTVWTIGDRGSIRGRGTLLFETFRTSLGPNQSPDKWHWS